MVLVKIFNKLRRIRLQFRSWRATGYMRAFCYLYGVKLGTGCKFWGRATVYKETGALISFGNDCIVRSDVDSNLIGVNHRCIFSALSPVAELKVGNNCAFSGTSIGARESIVLGNNVLVGANSVITDFDWHSHDPADRDNMSLAPVAKVKIGNNVWIGANCMVLKGVEIGDNTIVGAGSLVVSSLPANSICAGVPCKVIRTLDR